jgi:2,4-dienoyl-CoA reductase-like NADH-dependent reductase (Old Yellow Enzyme family)
VNEAFTQFYKARSKVGFMILGAAFIHPEGKGFKRQLGIHDDRVIPGLATLTQQLERRTRTAIQPGRHAHFKNR